MYISYIDPYVHHSLNTQSYNPKNMQCQFCNCKHGQFSYKQTIAHNWKMIGCIWQDFF
jgi:hypothetical protein